MNLHHVFSFNAILAHAVDYMLFIAKKKTSTNRKCFIKSFDERYAIDGCSHINNKFALLDAVNNSFKHVELDKNRYKHLTERYEDLSFHSFKPDQGKVFFDMPSYRFDYSRVVLRPIAAIFNAPLGSTHTVYQQAIDWDLPVNTRNGIKTNLDLALEGKSPFVVKNGKYSQINLHHSKQNGLGSLFELSADTHRKYYGTKALHPHLPNAHPINPVNRDQFNICPCSLKLLDFRPNEVQGIRYENIHYR